MDNPPGKAGYESFPDPHRMAKAPLHKNSTSTARTSCSSLPNELLRHIFSYLDGPRPSASALLDEPHIDLTKSNDTSLKNASLVAQKWRQNILPLLFTHAQFTLEATKSARSVLDRQIQPFYDFLKANDLGNIILTFALLVQDNKIAHVSEFDHGHQSFSSFWSTLFKVIDPYELLIVAPPEALGDLASCTTFLQDQWAFNCPFQYLRLQQHGKSSPIVKAPTVSSHTTPAAEGSSFSPYLFNRPHSSQEVQRSQSVDTTSNFACSSRPGAATPVLSSASSSSSIPSLKAQDILPERQSSLWELRPWSSLLLNEGSFIRAYASYEFWLRQPPSLLPNLLGHENPPTRPLISPTIKDFSYISMFPMTHHFGLITANCPRIDRLYVQLVPRNDILQSSTRMAQVEAEDLWMERNSCYALLMRELFTTPPLENFKHLKYFESGDAADEEAWQLAVEYVKRSSNGWKIGGHGVFVKEGCDVKEAAEDETELSALSVHSDK